MKRHIRVLIALPLILLVFDLEYSRAQFLIHTKIKNLKKTENLFLGWYHEFGEDRFGVVPTLDQLDRNSIPYSILDADVETATHYWIDSFNDLTGLEEACKSARGEILWNNQYRALIRSPYTNFTPAPMTNYMVTRIRFQKPVPEPRKAAPALRSHHTADSLIIQTIMDSVSIDTLYQLERHLTGEEPFFVDGTDLDSIMSRYSYHYQIVTARDYIQYYLEQIGYAVALQPFILYQPVAAAFTHDDAVHGWMVSENRIYTTSSGGDDWELRYSESMGRKMHSVCSVGNGIVITVGGEGTLLRTSDSGENWERLPSHTEQDLFHVFFADEKTGWVCGESGTILRTSDGGESWSVQQTPVNTRLYQLFFTDTSEGWIVGKSGTILYSEDSGKTWEKQNSESSETLKAVWFTDSENGFSVGWNGTALKTTNGGQAWNPVHLPVQGHYQDIVFSGSQFGMIAGLHGVCLVTYDGGLQWELAGGGLQQDISGIQIDGNRLRLTGEYGFISSSDRGNTWQTNSGGQSAVTLHNVMATKTGTAYPDEYWIIIAHYDCTSQDPYYRAPGADDNGSGTATVMEAARVLANYNFLYSIKFLLVPGEEQGLWGSRVYAANAAVTSENIRGVINLDMIGYDSDDDGHMEIHCGGMTSSQEIGNLINKKCTDWRIPLTPTVKTYGSTNSSDHSSFWDVGYPAVLLIEDISWDPYPFYHSTNDILDYMNASYYHDNSRLAIGSLALLAVPDTSQTSVPVESAPPENFRLLEPYPNPFNPEVTIEYRLPRSGFVTIEIFDLLGHTVHQPVRERQTAGQHRIIWNGTDKNGLPLASGVYFIRAKYLDQTALKKIILLK